MLVVTQFQVGSPTAQERHKSCPPQVLVCNPCRAQASVLRRPGKHNKSHINQMMPSKSSPLQKQWSVARRTVTSNHQHTQHCRIMHCDFEIRIQGPRMRHVMPGKAHVHERAATVTIISKTPGSGYWLRAPQPCASMLLGEQNGSWHRLPPCSGSRKNELPMVPGPAIAPSCRFLHVQQTSIQTHARALASTR